MKNLLKIYFQLAILLITFNNLLIGNDTTYVTPSELEEGWGVYWTNPYNEYIPDPKSIIFFLQVSPDGKWLFWEDDFGLNLMNLETREVEIIDKYLSIAEWHPNSVDILYGHGWYPDRFIILYNIHTKLKDTIRCPESNLNCSFGSYFGMDGNRYFSTPFGNNKRDSTKYRFITDSSRKLGYPVYDSIGRGDTNMPYPKFPPNTMDYFLDAYPSAYYEVKTGFDVIRNLDYSNRSKIRIELPDTSWDFSACNTAGSMDYAIKPIEVGPRGDVYLLLSFRSKKEIETRCNPKYWDSSTKAARNASGWYRVDTNGTNLVQLVRSWTYGMGGISITADGNTIYYGMLEKDTNASIWRMDRFGRNKEMVVKLRSIFSDVENKMNDLGNISVYPNPASERVFIEFGVWSWEFGVGEIGVYDVFGERIISLYPQVDSKEGIELDVSGLPQGMYYLVVKTGGKRFTERFAVIR